MSERGIKVDDDHKDIHDEGGDDEVRAGSSCDSPALEPRTRFVRDWRPEELGELSSKTDTDDIPIGRNICNEKKGS